MGFVILACSGNEFVNQTQSMGEIGWIQKNKFEIPFEITDTTTLYDMQVAIRQTNTYSFYNLYFISEILNGDGTRMKKAEAEAIFYDAKFFDIKNTLVESIKSRISSPPVFEVIMIIVLRKSTSLPSLSLICPLSNI